MSLADLLFADAVGAGDPRAGEVAVHWGDESWTLSRLRARATDVACALADAGVGEGAPVAVMLPDGPDVVAALFGVWRAGGVYVPLNPRQTAPEVVQVTASVHPAAVVTTDEHAHRFGDLPVVVPAADRVMVRPGVAGDERLDGDVALVQFTSGTTGPPKPVLLTHAGVASLIDGVLRKLRSGAVPDRARAPMPNLVPVSLSLWAGLYNVLFALRVGAPVVIVGRFEPVAFAALVRRHGIRSTVLPPAAMAMLSDAADAGTVTDLAPLRFVRSITAPLSPLQARRFRDRFGVAVLNSYGQTEIGGEIIGWNAGDSAAHGEDKLGSIGRPHDGVALRVVDDSGVDVTGDAAGELWVRTPALAAGYAGGTDLSDRLSSDGWFRTGDVARIDGDGFVWIEGRLSDMVNRGGLKVFPAEVEEVLRLSPDVADVAVVGVPDERLGEVPCAFVVPRHRGVPPDPAALEALCRAHLAPYKVPVRVTALDELPRNEVGKVLRSALARQATAPTAGGNP
ncbi:MAG TPA: class I adenylate-forming enzyme family protein [Acidimicrobiales bacterium]|nr:class I adenylate-forming enzyme family protein [Acidimicrobiales bacterium]